MPEFAPPSRASLVSLLWGGVTTIDRRWNHPLDGHFWRLYLNDRPGQVIAWGAERMRVPAKRLTLVPPGGGFHGTCTTDVGHLFIHFELRGMTGDNWNSPIVVERDPVRDALADSLRHLPPGSGRWWLRARTVVCDCLAAIPGLEGDRPATVVPVVDPLLEAIAQIEAHPGHRWTAGRLAGLCGMETARFARLFRASRGIPPMTYLRQRRLTIAAERLIATGEPIPQLAASCGFANRRHFTTLFTLRYGMGPATYRRRGR